MQLFARFCNLLKNWVKMLFYSIVAPKARWATKNKKRQSAQKSVHETVHERVFLNDFPYKMFTKVQGSERFFTGFAPGLGITP